MLHRLTPHEFANIPLRKLPMFIPAEFIDQMPPETQPMLQEMLLRKETQRISDQVNDANAYGTAVSNAIEMAYLPRADDNLAVLGPMTKKLRGTLKELNKTEDFDVRELTKQINEISHLVTSARDELVARQRAIALLRKQIGPSLSAPNYKRFRDAIAALERSSSPLEKVLRRFIKLRMAVAIHEMSDLRKRLKHEAYNQRQIFNEIKQLKKKLDRHGNMLHRAISLNHAQIEKLQQQLHELVAKQKLSEVLIPEDDLLRWLDTLIDASLEPQSAAILSTQLSKARTLLFALLTQYCHQQENAAQQIAKLPFAQIDPAQAISYTLLSEKFLLNYFSQRKMENNPWIASSTLNKQNDIDSLLDDLLKELRRNRKK